MTSSDETAEERLRSSRLRAEQHFSEVRRALHREVGWKPDLKVWAWPLIAFAGGVVLAGAARLRRRLSAPADDD